MVRRMGEKKRMEIKKMVKRMGERIFILLVGPMR